MTVDTSAATEFTRYSPADPKVAMHSNLADIKTGDQLHIIGQPGSSPATLTATKIYSAPVRTLAGTITSIAPDGKQLVVKNLQTKQPQTIALTDTSVIRKLPPQMAAFMARRLNPGSAANGAGSRSGAQDHDRRVSSRYAREIGPIYQDG